MSLWISKSLVIDKERPVTYMPYFPDTNDIAQSKNKPMSLRQDQIIGLMVGEMTWEETASGSPVTSYTICYQLHVSSFLLRQLHMYFKNKYA